MEEEETPNGEPGEGAQSEYPSGPGADWGQKAKHQGEMTERVEEQNLSEHRDDDGTLEKVLGEDGPFHPAGQEDQPQDQV